MVNAALLWTYVDITTCEWGPREKLLDNLLLTVFCKEASVFYFNFFFWRIPCDPEKFSLFFWTTFHIPGATKCLQFPGCVCACMFSSVQFSSVAQLCPTLCHHIDWSTPGFSSHHWLLELAQSHVHRVSDAILPSYPLSSPSPPALHLARHQDLFRWVSSLHQVAEVPNRWRV